MKRSTVALITAGLILGGAGVVEILEPDPASSAPVPDHTVSVVAPDRTNDSVATGPGHHGTTTPGIHTSGP